MILPAEIDWGLPLKVICAQLGCSVFVLFREFQRRFPGQRKRIRITPPAQKVSWEEFRAWDWSLTNIDLAERHGVTRERVRQIRQGLGFPPLTRGMITSVRRGYGRGRIPRGTPVNLKSSIVNRQSSMEAAAS